MKRPDTIPLNTTDRASEMEGFIDWLYNRVQNVHPLSNEQFMDILETKF